ncbi:MAG: hypothetical protein ABW061_06160 [Polyangiaceae bacterium]
MSILSLCGVAHAEDPSIQIGPNEVYLSTKTGQFSGRLKVGYDDANINQVVVIAPEGSQVTIRYWRRVGSACPGKAGEPLNRAAIPLQTTLVHPSSSGAAVRSGAPTGQAVTRNDVREQKFVAKVGPLAAGITYCLAYEVSSSKKLSDDEKKVVDSALDATVDELATKLNDATLDPKAASKLAGAEQRAEQERLCAETLRGRDTDKDQPSLELKAEDFANLFNCQLGWPQSEWIVTNPVDNSVMKLKDAITLYLGKDAALRESVNQAWTARISAQVARRELLKSLADTGVKSLIAVENAWPKSADGKPRRLSYDPIGDLDPAEFLKTLQGDELKKTLAEASKDRAVFTHALYENRAPLNAATARKAPTLPAELDRFRKDTAILKSFLENPSESKAVELPAVVEANLETARKISSTTSTTRRSGPRTSARCRAWQVQRSCKVTSASQPPMTYSS